MACNAVNTLKSAKQLRLDWEVEEAAESWLCDRESSALLQTHPS